MKNMKDLKMKMLVMMTALMKKGRMRMITRRTRRKMMMGTMMTMMV